MGKLVLPGGLETSLITSSNDNSLQERSTADGNFHFGETNFKRGNYDVAKAAFEIAAGIYNRLGDTKKASEADRRYKESIHMAKHVEKSWGM